MRYTKENVRARIESIERQGFKVSWTCCSPEGSLRWWISVEKPETRFTRSEIFGNTREVVMWLKGVQAGLWLFNQEK